VCGGAGPYAYPVRTKYRQPRRAKLLDAHIYFGVALAGLVSFLSPCVLPLVPPYLGYLGGMTIEQMTAERGLEARAWRRVVLAAFCFVIGFTTVFVGLGAGASVVGQFIHTYKAELAMVAGAVIILFGLHFLGLLRIPLLYREARYHAQMDGATLVGAYVMGLAFAFGWTPCIGPILATVLALAANEATLGAGVGLLFVYSLGLGIPFLLAAVAIRPFMTFMQRFKRHLGIMEKVMGALLVITGIMFLTGSMNWLGQWLLDNVPILSRIEEMATPDTLQTEIMKQGRGQ
jgi:cytochrome c-type biogenesis protein